MYKRIQSLLASICSAGRTESSKFSPFQMLCTQTKKKPFRCLWTRQQNSLRQQTTVTRMMHLRRLNPRQWKVSRLLELSVCRCPMNITVWVSQTPSMRAWWR
ncbi:hypothetical protein DPMN_134145 [Dreissena polymorpha]|uniref:Uncharacterized protein n=1 Tax=Dreissena polymorpha TaxID=45954 RepID=A0A9D4JAG2_DREPO|nr:hypothetical protein DPMN_134145 [Dreissena polymorpha]